MLISNNLHKKSIEVSIKTRSPPASLLFKGHAAKHTTVKWSIDITGTGQAFLVPDPKLKANPARLSLVHLCKRNLAIIASISF